MNKGIFKSIWNAKIGSWVAASETAKSHASISSSMVPVSSRSTLPLPSRKSSIATAIASCFSLPIFLLSTTAFAVNCTGSHVTPNGPDCNIEDGTYRSISVSNASTVRNNGQLNLTIPNAALARGVQVLSDNAAAFLHNVTATGTTSTNQLYGLDAAKGNILLTGNYNFTATTTGSGQGLGIAAGELPSVTTGTRGFVTIEGDTNITIRGTSTTLQYGIVSRGRAGQSLVTLKGNLDMNLTGEKVYGIGADPNAGNRVSLEGEQNKIVVTGKSSIGAFINAGGSFAVENDLNLTTAGIGGNHGLWSNNATITLKGNNTLNTTGHGLYANGSTATVTSTGTTQITTSGLGNTGATASSGGGYYTE